MQIIHYVPCECQLLPSCECGVKTIPTSSKRKINNGEEKTITIPDPDPDPDPDPPVPDPPVPDPYPDLTIRSRDDPPPPSTIDKIISEVRRGGLIVSFYLANFQFKAFTATLTSQWGLSLYSAVIITNIQHGFRSFLVILLAWPSTIFLGKNFTRIFSVVSYTIGMLLIYGTYPILVRKFFVPGLVLVTLGQCTSDIASTRAEVDDEEKRDGASPSEALHNCARDLWAWFKRYWVEILGFIVAVFLIPGHKKGLGIVIWMLLASSGFNILGQLGIQLRDDGIDGICGSDAISETLSKSSDIGSKWKKFRYIWLQTIDKKDLKRTLYLSMVFLPYYIISQVADNLFFQQVDEMKSLKIFNRSMPSQAIKLITQLLAKSVQNLSHWIYTKTDNGDAPRTRFYGTIRVGLAMVIAIPCYVIASLIETKRWEDVNTSVLWLIPQLGLIATVDGLASDGIDGFFELELPDSIGKKYGFLFVKGIDGLGAMLSSLWNIFWTNVSRNGGQIGWLDEHNDHRHRLDRYYSAMAIFADVGCIVFVCVAYWYSVKSHKWR